VLSYLTSRYRHSSEEEWRRRIEGGLVLLDGVATDARRRLREGETLVWNRPPWTEPEAPTSFAVLFEDADLLAVAKPSGLPTMPGGGFLAHTLLSLVRKRRPEASPLHRLGRGTSGIVLFTRNRRARRLLVDAWSRGDVERRYRAWVNGPFPSGESILEHPLGPVPHTLLGTVEGVSASGKRARTCVRLVERASESSLVDVAIDTGRTHQIRIHLAASGHPLVGDPLYPEGGVPDPAERTLPGEIGYRLHAYRLSFVHPGSGAPITIDCGPPPSYRARGE
jgi:23S rRNA pseudouridine1911/1915/1917 synthase